MHSVPEAQTLWSADVIAAVRERLDATVGDERAHLERLVDWLTSLQRAEAPAGDDGWLGNCSERAIVIK